MPWSGSGVYNRIYSWVTDAANGLDILADRMDQDTDDITNNGFGNCLTRDGQGFASANLPMNGFKHTNVGNGVQRTDYAALGQLQDGTVSYVVLADTADAYSGNLTPAITAYTVGAEYRVLAATPNTTAAPTVALNGQPATTIVDQAGNALVSGEFNGAHTLRFDGTNMRLLNPISPPPIAGNGIVVNGTTISALLHGQCRLQFTNATTLTLAPYNGQYIRIAGQVYAIPAAGVTASNTGTYLDGNPSSSLSPGGVYYVALANIGGTLTLGFWGLNGHTPDTTSGNVGVEIVENVSHAPQPAWTLVGMVAVNGGAQFQDDASFRGVASWFNRTNKYVIVSVSANTSSPSLVPLAISSIMLMWADQLYMATAEGNVGNVGGIDESAEFAITVDNSVVTVGIITLHSGWSGQLGTAAPVSKSDGAHSLNAQGADLGGSTVMSFSAGVFMSGAL